MIFYTNLPMGYSLSENIDPEKNKKDAQVVNFLTVLLALVMLVPMMLLNFPQELPEGWLLALPIVVCVAANILFLFVRELTQGMFFFLFTGKKPFLSFNADAFYTGSDAYVDKAIYALVTILPTVVWGIVFLVLNLVLTGIWFWVFYIVQVFNVAATVGVIFVVAKLAKMPKNVLIQDDGTKINVYRKGLK